MGRDTMDERRFIGWQPRWDPDARRVRFDRVFAARSAPDTVQLPPELPPVALYPDARQTKIVTKGKKDTSHLFHLIMTILTGGLWIFVWAGMTAWHKGGPRKKSVTKITTSR